MKQVNYKILTAKEALKQTEDLEKERERISDIFEDSVRVTTIEEVKKVINDWTEMGYKRTIFGPIKSLTRAERKIFEDLGYTLHNNGKEYHGFQSWDLIWDS